MEVRFGLLLALRQDLHLIELLLAAVGHAARRDARLVALDEVLLALDLRLLALVGRLFLAALQSGHLLELLVAARVARELEVVDMPDDIRHRIEERHIVRDDDEGILVIRQVVLEPFDVLGVEVVRRLVEQQDLGVLEQELRQEDLRALTARELVDLALEPDVAQAEAARDLLDARIDRVVAARLEDVLDVADILHELVHLLRRGLAHLVVSREHLLLERHEMVKRRAQRLPDRHARLQHRMLVEIADLRALRPGHLPRIRRQLARDDRHERRLALAVRTDQRHMLPLQQAERHILKDLSPAIAVRKMRNLQYAHTLLLTYILDGVAIEKIEAAYRSLYLESRYDYNIR